MTASAVGDRGVHHTWQAGPLEQHVRGARGATRGGSLETIPQFPDLHCQSLLLQVSRTWHAEHQFELEQRVTTLGGAVPDPVDMVVARVRVAERPQRGVAPPGQPVLPVGGQRRQRGPACRTPSATAASASPSFMTRASSSSHSCSLASRVLHTSASTRRLRPRSISSTPARARLKRASIAAGAGPLSAIALRHCSCASRWTRRISASSATSACASCSSCSPAPRTHGAGPASGGPLPCASRRGHRTPPCRRRRTAPQRALIALLEDDRLRVRLPARLQVLDPCRQVALRALRRQRLGLGNERLSFLPCLPACRGQRLVQRGQDRLQPCIEFLPGARIDAA